MKPRIARQAGALAACVAMAFSAGWAAAATPPSEPAALHQQHRMERMQMKMKERIAKMASRLEIKASQQGPWAEYVKARESMLTGLPARPARDADAATIAKARADFVGDMARKLAAISDATAGLQAVLTADQRKVFDEIARRGGPRGFGAHREGRGEHGGHRERGRPGSHHHSPDQRSPR